MKITSLQYAKSLSMATEGVSPDQSKDIINNFIKLLWENKDFKKFEEILEKFEKQEKQKKGIQNVYITVAESMSKEIKDKIIEKIKKITKRENIVINEKIDNTILGGIIIEFNDYLFDASLRTKIRKLGKNLYF